MFSRFGKFFPSARRKANHGAVEAAKNIHSTEFEVDTWELSRFVLAKLIPVVGIHPFPLHELMLMSAAVCRTRPSQIFDWGTHIGKSARIFFECASHFGIAAEIHSIDLPDDIMHGEHPHEDRGKLVRGIAQVHLHQGDGLDIALNQWSAGGRKAVPLFFLDGDHSYESVLRELEGIGSATPDANILLHDAFYQSPDSGYNVGPHRAIERFMQMNSSRYRRIDSGLGLPGMTFLYRH